DVQGFGGNFDLLGGFPLFKKQVNGPRLVHIERDIGLPVGLEAFLLYVNCVLAEGKRLERVETLTVCGLGLRNSGAGVGGGHACASNGGAGGILDCAGDAGGNASEELAADEQHKYEQQNDSTLTAFCQGHISSG